MAHVHGKGVMKEMSKVKDSMGKEIVKGSTDFLAKPMFTAASVCRAAVAGRRRFWIQLQEECRDGACTWQRRDEGNE